MLVCMQIRLPTREEIHLAFAQGEEAVVDLILNLGTPFEALAKQLETQAAALQELQSRLGKTSQNSSKPPASDGYRKPNRTEVVLQIVVNPHAVAIDRILL